MMLWTNSASSANRPLARNDVGYRMQKSVLLNARGWQRARERKGPGNLGEYGANVDQELERKMYSWIVALITTWHKWRGGSLFPARSARPPAVDGISRCLARLPLQIVRGEGHEHADRDPGMSNGKLKLGGNPQQ